MCKFSTKSVNVFHTSPLGYLTDPLSIGLLRAGSLGSYGLGLFRENILSFYFVGPEVRVRKYGFAGTSRSVTSQKMLKGGQKKCHHFIIGGMKIFFFNTLKRRPIAISRVRLANSDRPTNGQTDGPKDQRTNGPTDRQSGL